MALWSSVFVPSCVSRLLPLVVCVASRGCPVGWFAPPSLMVVVVLVSSEVMLVSSEVMLVSSEISVGLVVVMLVSSEVVLVSSEISVGLVGGGVGLVGDWCWSRRRLVLVSWW